MLETQNLRRTFGQKVAVHGLNLTVEKGQVMALLGPNGAGKSTTMKMLTGFLKPTSGRALIQETDIWKHPRKAKQQIGYLPESAPLYSDQSVLEYLTYLGHLKRLKGPELKSAIDRAIDRCFLSSVRNQAINSLSKGYRHRVCLAQSILADPPILIFDEPTDGLDPNQKQEIRNLIDEFRQDKAIILSTHILEEVNAVATHVLLMHQGKKLFYGTPDLLRTTANVHGTLKIKLGNGQTEAARKFLTEVPAIESIASPDPKTIILSPADRPATDRSDFSQKVLHALQSQNISPEEMHYLKGHLPDIFRDLTSNDAA